MVAVRPGTCTDHNAATQKDIEGPVLDTTRSVETPEGIELGLRVAGVVPRALAWGIDTFIRTLAYAAIWISLVQLERFGVGVALILTFLTEWFYPVFGEVYFDGRTFGKHAMRIRVVHDDGTSVGWSASMVRNLLRFADFLPLLYGFGITTMLIHHDFKRLGDIVAGTRVIYSDDAGEPVELPAVPALTPPVALSPEEQQAIIHYAERVSTLTEERALELAELTGPLIWGEKHPDKKLLAFASWAAGAR